MQHENGLEILYVEDDPATALLVERRLARAGIRVAVQGSGEAGLEAARLHRYDVVVLDYDLPGINGLEVLREIIGAGDPPPVVMMTANGDERVAVAAMRLGVYDYVVKDSDGHYSKLLPGVLERVLSKRRLEEARRHADELARITLRSIGDAVVAVDAAGRITLLNEMAEAATGWSFTEAVGRPVGEVLAILDEESGAPARIPLAEVLDVGRAVPLYNNSLLQRRDGGTIAIENSLAPIHGRNGEVAGAVLVFKDVTERKRHQKALELFEKVVHNAGEAMMITDAAGTILDVNQAFTEITGYPRDEVVGGNPRIMKSDRHDALFYRELWRALTGAGRWQGEIWDRRKNGELFAKWVTINAVCDGHGRTTHYVSVFSDISPFKRTEVDLQRRAFYDPLTGLPNRVLFYDRLHQRISHADRSGELVAVLFIDLDRFKEVNDRLGHSAGDELLIQVAERLRRIIREEDTVARLGGDEFTMVLGGLPNIQAAVRLAEKILDVMTPPFLAAGTPLTVSPSIGIALYPLAGGDPEAVVRAADAAMYRAKEGGRNGFRLFRADLDATAQSQSELEHQLQHAAEREQLELHYQPQFNLRSGGCNAVEALLRWRHPTAGSMLPGEFLPLAEESGLILPIGHWVVEEACRGIAALRRAGRPELRVAVNLSARQLADPTLKETIVAALAAAGLPAEALELEVTEHAVMRDPEQTLALLAGLKGLGVRIAIDNFGTGYLGLNFLHRLPIDTLKIDGSFVRNLGLDDAAAKVARLIVAMARTLGITVVAEGVESSEQATLLRHHDCCDVQGFYLGRPVPLAELPALLERPLPGGE